MSFVPRSKRCIQFGQLGQCLATDFKPALHARGSGCIHRLTVAVDAGQHIGVAHRAGLDQINSATQQMFQLCFCIKKFLQAWRGVFGKLNQKIHIAGGRVEVICPCCRAKHVQAAYMKALANGGDAGTVLGYGGVQGKIVGDGI